MPATRSAPRLARSACSCTISSRSSCSAMCGLWKWGSSWQAKAPAPPSTRRSHKGSTVFEQGQEFFLDAFGGGVVGGDDQNGVVAGDGADHFGPLLVIQRDGDGVGVAGRGFEDHLVLGAQHVARSEEHTSELQ